MPLTEILAIIKLALEIYQDEMKHVPPEERAKAHVRWGKFLDWLVGLTDSPTP